MSFKNFATLVAWQNIACLFFAVFTVPVFAEPAQSQQVPQCYFLKAAYLAPYGSKPVDVFIGKKVFKTNFTPNMTPQSSPVPPTLSRLEWKESETEGEKIATLSLPSSRLGQYFTFVLLKGDSGAAKAVFYDETPRPKDASDPSREKYPFHKTVRIICAGIKFPFEIDMGVLGRWQSIKKPLTETLDVPDELASLVVTATYQSKLHGTVKVSRQISFKENPCATVWVMADGPSRLKLIVQQDNASPFAESPEELAERLNYFSEKKEQAQ